MKLPRPDDVQAPLILQALAAVMTGGGGRPLTALEAQSLAAIARWILQREAPVPEAGPLPGGLAEALADPALRRMTARLAALVPLVEQRYTPASAEALGALVEALGLAEDPELAEVVGWASDFAAGRFLRFRWALLRHIMDDYIAAEPGQPRWRDWVAVARSAAFAGARDAALAARYEALGALPEGSLGRALYTHHRRHGFPFPGERGSFDDLMEPHELSHVLSGYAPHGYGEMLVSAFTAGYATHHPLDLLLLGLLQYHCGQKVDYQPQRGLLVPEEFFEALARGAAMNTDLMDRWDWRGVLDQPLGEVRATLGVPPLQAAPLGVPA